MCNLQEHSARPQPNNDDDWIWHRDEGKWILRTAEYQPPVTDN